MPYQINEGDGRFYGPKIDVSCGCRTEMAVCPIQCDFTLPERFTLFLWTRTAEDTGRHDHRVILGALSDSLESSSSIMPARPACGLAPGRPASSRHRQEHRPRREGLSSLKEAGVRLKGFSA